MIWKDEYYIPLKYGGIVDVKPHLLLLDNETLDIVTSHAAEYTIIQSNTGFDSRVVLAKESKPATNCGLDWRNDIINSISPLLEGL